MDFDKVVLKFLKAVHRQSLEKPVYLKSVFPKNAPTPLEGEDRRKHVLFSLEHILSENKLYESWFFPESEGYLQLSPEYRAVANLRVSICAPDESHRQQTRRMFSEHIQMLEALQKFSQNVKNPVIAQVLLSQVEDSSWELRNIIEYLESGDETLLRADFSAS